MTATNKLWDFQAAAVGRTLTAIRERPILVAPTGSGKTTMAAEIVREFGGRCLWLTHRRELVRQAADRLEAHGLDCGVIMAGELGDYDAPVQVASIHTLARRDNPPADLVVIDECHHATAAGYADVLREYAGACLLGLTATPFRLDGRGLGDIFRTLVVAATPAELCDRGYLHAPKVYAGPRPDLRGVRTVAGDYSLGPLAERMADAKLCGDIVATWQRLAAGRRTVAFAVNIEHSRMIVAAFAEAGVKAMHLDGSTPRDERDAILERLRNGEIDIVSNCMVLTEGWDLPALGCAIIARPTASLCLHLQMIGRVMRAAHGKDGALVLDHAGNHHTHGLVTEEIDYALDGERIATPAKLGLRRCKECYYLYPPSEPSCPECGAVYAADESDPPEVRGPGELVEFRPVSFTDKAAVWEAIEGQRIAAGYKPGWSYYRYVDQFGESPCVVDGKLINPSRATTQQKQAVFRQLLQKASEKGYKPGWAAYQYRARFGVWPRKVRG